MRRITLAVAIGLVVLLANPAFADGSNTVQWEGAGSENLPCDDGVHWILSPARGITAAVLTIEGQRDFPMYQSGSFVVDTPGAFDGSQAVSAFYVYTGTDPRPRIKLGDCLSSPSPSPSPVPSPTPSPSPSPTASPTPFPSPTTSPSSTTGGGGSPGDGPTDGWGLGGVPRSESSTPISSTGPTLTPSSGGPGGSAASSEGGGPRGSTALNDGGGPRGPRLALTGIQRPFVSGRALWPIGLILAFSMLSLFLAWRSER
jgi:hypothetical protein